MRNLIVATAGTIAAVALTACGTATHHAADEPSDDRTDNLRITEPKHRFNTAERAYLDALEVVYPDLTSAPVVRKQAVKTGHAVCERLDAGVTVDDIVKAYATSNVDQELAAGILLAAVSELCPEYRADLDAAIDGGVAS